MAKVSTFPNKGFPLAEKERKRQTDEIQKIVKSQQILEEVIATNAEAIKRIDNEIREQVVREQVVRTAMTMHYVLFNIRPSICALIVRIG